MLPPEKVIPIENSARRRERPMPHTGYTTEEVARRGREIYEQKLRREVEPEHEGRFLIVDIERGDYEVGDDDLEATERLLARRPDGVLYGLRVGRNAAYRLMGAELGA
jgi:hypothetical protein